MGKDKERKQMKQTIYHQKGSFIVGCGCLVVIVGLVVFVVFL